MVTGEVLAGVQDGEGETEAVRTKMASHLKDLMADSEFYRCDKVRAYLAIQSCQHVSRQMHNCGYQNRILALKFVMLSGQKSYCFL